MEAIRRKRGLAMRAGYLHLAVTFQTLTFTANSLDLAQSLLPCGCLQYRGWNEHAAPRTLCHCALCLKLKRAGPVASRGHQKIVSIGRGISAWRRIPRGCDLFVDRTVLSGLSRSQYVHERRTELG